MFKPTMDIVELCLTYRCNLRCNNCSGQCSQAPIKGDLSIDEVGRFIRESVEINYPWKCITIHGGEPALHPDFVQICGMLANYRDRFNRDCTVWALTNYSTNEIGMRLKTVNHEYKIGIGRADKKEGNRNPNGTPMLYVPVNESPVDVGVEPTMGCFQTRDCGICLNYLGWWECSPAGAAARVFGYEPMAKHVSELTEEWLSGGYPLHCRHCGFANPQRDRVFEQVTSPTWGIALKSYIERIA